MSSPHAVNPDLVLKRENIYPGDNAGKALAPALMVAGGVALALTIIGALLGGHHGPHHALSGYHIGFVFATGTMLGALGFTMMLHLTGGSWGVTVRRQFENIASLAPLTALLAIPVLLDVVYGGILWHWMDKAYVAGDPIYEHKQPFLNIPFFLLRNVIYFAVWIGLAYAMNSLSRRQDADGDKWKTNRLARISTWGMLLYALTVAFAGFDWLMALDYHWFSTMFGVYFFAGNILSAMAAVILILAVLTTFGRLHGVVTVEHFHDLGKLLFGLTVFWAYISFSQYMLIWYANIPEETWWFQVRRQGGWMGISQFLAIGKFILPFLLLLPRAGRRNPVYLAVVAAWLIGAHLIELFWVIRPQISIGEGVSLSWIDFIAPLGPILLFAGVLVRRITTGPLIPTRDPKLLRSLSHKNYI